MMAPHVGMSWGILFLAPVALALLALPLFWLWMLVDCLSRDCREFGTLITGDRAADKLLWVLLILVLPVVGAIAYHVGVRRRPAGQRAAGAR